MDTAPTDQGHTMRAEPVDICVIDDDAAQRALLFRHLMSSQYSVIEAGDGHAGLAQIRRHRPRVVICDLLLPRVNGIELCRRVRADSALDGTYVIVVTGCQDRDSKNQALLAGADDYLVKPYDREELSARLRNGLRVSKLQERLRRAALTDGLTGLWNHAYFRELADREFARTRRYGGSVALLMLDLDHFKAVNDTYGHEVGNQVLQAVAQHLQRLVRDTDIVARYGGEEFAVICPESGFDEAARLAERMRDTLAREVRLPGLADLHLTVSIGVAATGDPGVHNVCDLINRADYALYLGKRAGRNRVVRSDAAAADLGAGGVEMGEVVRLQREVVSLSLQAKELCLHSVWAFVQALEARDRRTAWHSRNTTWYVNVLARAAGWSDALRTAVANAAMLHDLGKIGVPDRILQKPEPLSEEDAAVLRQVPLLTCKILEPLRVFETETLIVRHLRERWDGTGYPLGLAGTTIPVGARLLAIAETFDALTSNRPYRTCRSLDEALETIAAEAGRQFDPQFVDLLRRVASEQRDPWQARILRMLAHLHDRRSGPLALPGPDERGAAESSG